LDGSHIGKIAAKTLVVAFGGGEPYSVIRIMGGFFTKDGYDFLGNVDGETTEHWPGYGREGS
jgi:hypothetical protein